MNEQTTGYLRLVLAIWDQIDIYEGGAVWLKTIEAVDRTTALLYAAYFAQYEICNGGFWQLFGNNTGVLVPEAIQGFRMIGQLETALVVEAMAKLLGEPYPRERDARQTLIAAIGKEAMNRANRSFYELLEKENGGFDKAADAFVARGGFAEPIS